MFLSLLQKANIQSFSMQIHFCTFKLITDKLNNYHVNNKSSYSTTLQFETFFLKNLRAINSNLYHIACHYAINDAIICMVGTSNRSFPDNLCNVRRDSIEKCSNSKGFGTKR